ncbi:MAG: hypothetical protein RL296_701 [Actinomycetota bacterium]
MLKNHPLKGRTAVLSTKHQKGSSIAPAMELTLGMYVSEVDVDTDLLGTFAGEIERTNGPVETVIRKARMGLDASGAMLGLASEGSIGTDSMFPMMVDVEIVAFVNVEDGYEVWESIRSYDITARSACVDRFENLDAFLVSADFPNHGLIVRPSDQSHSLVFKGIHDFDVLKKSVREVLNISADSRVIIETDLRAHHCPSRRFNIEKAASKLATRLRELCPACLTPGWGVVRVNRGLPCDWCAMETRLIREEIFGCTKCEHEEVAQNLISKTADPQWCERCNP